MKKYQHKRRNVQTIALDYFNKMIASVKGIKSLILDEETTTIISLVLNRKTIFERDVYLIKRIEALKPD